MATYSISKSFGWQGRITEKVAQVCRMFGLTTDRLTERRVIRNLQLEINDGDIVYITGPSGAGKSVLLGELERAIPASERVNFARIKLPSDKTLIDCIDGDFLGGLRVLSTAGLNDVFCVLMFWWLRNCPAKRKLSIKKSTAEECSRELTRIRADFCLTEIVGLGGLCSKREVFGTGSAVAIIQLGS